MASQQPQRTSSPNEHSRTGSFDEDRSGLIARLDARRLEIAEAIVARVRDVVPDPVRDDDPEHASGMRAAVTAAIDYWLLGIAQGEGQQAPIPAAAVAQAHRAARDDVSLDTVLRRYIAAHTRLEDFVIQEANHSDAQGHRTVLGEVLRTQASLFDRLIASIAAEFMDERKRAARSQEQRRAELVQLLLAGGPVEAAELGYELDAWHLGINAAGARAAQTVRGLAVGLDRQLLSVVRSGEVVWAWLGGQRRLAVADVERYLSSRKLPEASLAIGEPARGTDGWRSTHHQAQRALLVARRAPQRLTRYADVALLAVALQDEALAMALINIYLAPLDSSRKGAPPLRETLRAYLKAERNISSAAAALKVTRHTVESRLHTIEDRLGRLLPTCLAELEVALRLEELGVASRGWLD